MVESILKAFHASFRPLDIISFGNHSGFSGAQLWKVRSRQGDLCVRKWPSPHPNIDQLRWIHDTLARAHAGGCKFIPAPFQDQAGSSIVVEDGQLWEVAPWLSGQADLLARYSKGKLALACRGLARFHRSVCMDPAAARQVSPGMRERYELTLRFSRQLPQFFEASHQLPNGRTRTLCSEIVDLARRNLEQLPSLLMRVLNIEVPLQPCIRDIWHQHVLYEENQLTGIVDFGAMRIESVALDVARLLGSVETCDPDVWQHGLSAYCGERPLEPAELKLVEAAAQATATLSGLNWVNWLAIQHRVFEELDFVHARMSEILAQLRLRNGYSF